MQLHQVQVAELCSKPMHGKIESYTRIFGGYLEVLCFSISFAKLCKTFSLKGLRCASMPSEFSGSSPSEIISTFIEWLAWTCMDLLLEVVMTNVTLIPFEAKHFENWSIGFMCPSMRLPIDVCAFCVFFGWALFMDQLTCEKYNNSVLPFKIYFAIIFSTISFQFSAK